jgi:hypothetical protein
MNCERCGERPSERLVVLPGGCEVVFFGVCKPCVVEMLDDPACQIEAILTMPGDDGWSNEWTPAQYRKYETIEVAGGVL